jgi:Zn-dependent protease
VIGQDYTIQAGWYNPPEMLNLTLPVFISRVFTLVVAFSIHEFAHAWTADQLGDDTPRLNGRLTLNPLVHLDVIGSLLLLVTGFGWAKPVPINPYALQRSHRAGTMLVSAAGPFSNLLMAIMASLPFRAGLLDPFTPAGKIMPSTSSLLIEFIFINLILLFFNLIPLAPLDGEKVAEYFLPPGGQDFLSRIRPYGPMILLVLLFLTPSVGLDIFGWLVGWPTRQIFQMLVQ